MGAVLRLGTFSPSVVLRVARAVGVLERFGLDVAEVPVASSPAQFRSLLAGELDAVLTSPDNVVAYRHVAGNPLGRLADVRILLGVDRGMGLALYGRPGLRGVEELRGEVVGVDVAASGFAFVLYEILAAAGLARDRDVELAELGSTPRRVQALLDGHCAATMLNAGSDLRARSLGCVRLVRAVDACRPYLGTVLAATGEACEQDTDRLAALVGALAEVAEALRGGGYRDVAVAEAAAALDLDDALAARYVDMLGDADEGLVPHGTVDEAALSTVVGLRRSHARTPDGLEALAPPFPGLVDGRFLSAP
jgi:ABC-type nitrate/sulfonate/bicarbonate transport system substrate-binding protein